MKLREFNSAISKTLDLQEILDRTIRVMKELMDVDFERKSDEVINQEDLPF